MFTNDDYDDDTPLRSETLFNYLDRIELYESDVTACVNVLNEFTKF